MDAVSDRFSYDDAVVVDKWGNDDDYYCDACFSYASSCISNDDGIYVSFGCGHKSPGSFYPISLPQHPVIVVLLIMTAW